MAWNMDEYLELKERDYDYYLFWAEEFLNENFDELVMIESLVRMQIACSHILMDTTDDAHYQEDGFILGEIIFAGFEQERENKKRY